MPACATATCDVLVLGADDQPVADLTQADFEVLERRRAGPDRAVLAHSTPEVSVVMLVDGTASQPLKRYEILAGVMTGLITSLLPGDRARLAALGNPTVFGAWLPADRAAASQRGAGFLDRPPLEPSPIWDAIDAIVKALAGAPEPRVLLLMSDGRSTGNALSLDDAERRAIAARRVDQRRQRGRRVADPAIRRCARSRAIGRVVALAGGHDRAACFSRTARRGAR